MKFYSFNNLARQNNRHSWMSTVHQALEVKRDIILFSLLIKPCYPQPVFLYKIIELGTPRLLWRKSHNNVGRALLIHLKKSIFLSVWLLRRVQVLLMAVEEVVVEVVLVCSNNVVRAADTVALLTDSWPQSASQSVSWCERDHTQHQQDNTVGTTASRLSQLPPPTTQLAPVQQTLCSHLRLASLILLWWSRNALSPMFSIFKFLSYQRDQGSNHLTGRWQHNYHQTDQLVKKELLSPVQLSLVCPVTMNNMHDCHWITVTHSALFLIQTGPWVNYQRKWI